MISLIPHIVQNPIRKHSDIPIALKFTALPKVTQANDDQEGNKESTEKSNNHQLFLKDNNDEKYVIKNLNKNCSAKYSASFRHYNVVAIAMWENIQLI